MYSVFARNLVQLRNDLKAGTDCPQPSLKLNGSRK